MSSFLLSIYLSYLVKVSQTCFLLAKFKIAFKGVPEEEAEHISRQFVANFEIILSNNNEPTENEQFQVGIREIIGNIERGIMNLCYDFNPGLF